MDKPTVGVLQVLGAMLEDKPTASQEQDYKRLCYVLAELNDRSMQAMLDSGATQNFMKESVARELGLQLEPVQTSFKAVNSEVEKVIGIVNGVTLKLGEWSGAVDFTIVPMDDF